jgi:hypothetical protein
MRTPKAKALATGVVVAGIMGGCSVLVDLNDLAGGTRGASGDGGRGTDAATDVGDSGTVADAAAPDSGVPLDAGPCVPSGTVENKVVTPTAAVDDARMGSIAWLDVGNATVNDGAFARTGSMTGMVSTHWLRTSGFGAALPARSIVRGFIVRVTRKASFVDEIGDQSIAMAKAGVPGTGRVAAGSWPTTPNTVSYGSASDLWGTTWTPTDVNAADFGVAIAARGLPASDETASVDGVALTVYFERCAP